MRKYQSIFMILILFYCLSLEIRNFCWWNIALHLKIIMSNFELFIVLAFYKVQFLSITRIPCNMCKAIQNKWHVSLNPQGAVVIVRELEKNPTTCAISAYHHWSCEFEPCSWRGVLDTTLCDKVCQWLVTGLWFSLGTPASSNNLTDCCDKHHKSTDLKLHAGFF